MTNSAAPARVTVRLDVPADSSYSVLIRAAVAALAARQQFSLDRIEDARLAATEAFGLVALRASADAIVHVTITAGESDIDVAVVAQTDADRQSKGGPGSLGWTLLTSLVDQLSEIEREGDAGVWLSVRSDQLSPVPPLAPHDAPEHPDREPGH